MDDISEENVLDLSKVGLIKPPLLLLFVSILGWIFSTPIPPSKVTNSPLAGLCKISIDFVHKSVNEFFDGVSR